MNLAKDGILNIAGALLFSKRPQYRLPSYVAKGVCYEGKDIHEEKYIESIEASGRDSGCFSNLFIFYHENIPAAQNQQM